MILYGVQESVMMGYGVQETIVMGYGVEEMKWGIEYWESLVMGYGVLGESSDEVWSMV